mgnify:FL=1
MSEIYNEEYYHNGCGPIPYEEPEHWVEFFGMIADRIVNDLHPRTVLDAGCAMGYLVAALRDRGVEAYGVDISEYAISKVREDVRPFCRVASLTEAFPNDLLQHYDLVVTIEVLEHLYAEDGKKAIANLCKCADTVLFSSTPDDFEERTHVNVQQREYWARLFFEQGFTDDINYRPRYLTPYASLFRKNTDMVRQIEDYERNIRMTEGENAKNTAYLNQAVQDKETHIQNLTITHDTECKAWNAQESEYIRVQQELENKNASQKKEIKKIEQELAHYKEHYQAIAARNAALERQLAEAQNAYNVISNAFFWKITKPARVIADWIKMLLRKVAVFRLMNKGLRCLHENGWRYTWAKVRNKVKNQQNAAALLKKPLFTESELAEQRKHQFPKSIKFSIVVPLFNTPEKFLREMIQSVIDQTYANWELCLADGSDAEHGLVEKICRQYAKKDSRIKYKKLEKNLGISGNTNACLEMASGDYIGLFDHDDLLHPAALYEVMRAICEQDADFIYTDELTFSGNTSNIITAHFKPDYAPDNLRANNYICHFSVFSDKILENVKGFRSEYDGSQDHDFILRATECAKKIVHIPEILYYWRSHPNSVAADINSKPYASIAGRKAVHDHIARHNMESIVESTKAFPAMYRVEYSLKEKPLISIIIPNKNHIEDLRKCVNSILNKSTYPSYEIIIVDNDSDEMVVEDYYKALKQNEKIRIVSWNKKFNFSAICNYGVGFAKGRYVVLLNNDTEVITESWLEEMLMYAQRQDVGAVGAKLYFANNTIQHAGVVLGMGRHRTAGYIFSKVDKENLGYMGRLCYAQNLSAVTFACVMIPRHVWDEVGGLDESFAVAFNDVDMCMRIRKAGYLIVWTPYAELYHYESKSRGLEDTPEKKKRFEGEVKRFQERWKNELAAGDPYYNPNLSLDREDFSLR